MILCTICTDSTQLIYTLDAAALPRKSCEAAFSGREILKMLQPNRYLLSLLRTDRESTGIRLHNLCYRTHLYIRLAIRQGIMARQTQVEPSKRCRIKGDLMENRRKISKGEIDKSAAGGG